MNDEELSRALREARSESARLRRRVAYLEEILDAWKEAGIYAIEKLDPFLEGHPISQLFHRVYEATIRTQSESLADLQAVISIFASPEPGSGESSP
jgi:hypothetical protein